MSIKPKECAWFVPAELLAVLWGEFIPRLVASVWQQGPTGAVLKDKGFPANFPDEPYILDNDNNDADQKIIEALTKPFKDEPVFKELFKYFDRENTAKGKRVKVHLKRQEAGGYDFVTWEGGIAVFFPVSPISKDLYSAQDQGTIDSLEEDALSQFFQYFKYRKTGVPPIAIPGLGGSSRPTQRLNVAPGPSQVGNWWSGLDLEEDPTWWINGAVLGAVLADLPRVVASFWHEMKAGARDATYEERYKNEPGTLFAERLETSLPADKIHLVTDGAKYPKGWNKEDVMVTNLGLVLPPLPESPSLEEVLKSIVGGHVGNPVFTITGA